MDWKDILAQKVNDGELAREEFVIEEKNDKKTPDVIDVCLARGVEILIQGERLDETKKILSELGFKIKGYRK